MFQRWSEFLRLSVQTAQHHMNVLAVPYSNILVARLDAKIQVQPFIILGQIRKYQNELIIYPRNQIAGRHMKVASSVYRYEFWERRFS
jgi:hypothetical protein